MPDQTPNDYQEDHQNDGRTAGSLRLQEHPKLYGRKEEQVNIAFLKKKKKQQSRPPPSRRPNTHILGVHP